MSVDDDKFHGLWIVCMCVLSVRTNSLTENQFASVGCVGEREREREKDLFSGAWCVSYIYLKHSQSNTILSLISCCSLTASANKPLTPQKMRNFNWIQFFGSYLSALGWDALGWCALGWGFAWGDLRVVAWTWTFTFIILFNYLVGAWNSIKRN